MIVDPVKVFAAKEDPIRELAYERFKKERFVTQDYFLVNRQRL